MTGYGRQSQESKDALARQETAFLASLDAETSKTAQEPTKPKRATPAAQMGPFLAYHGECTRLACPLGSHDARTLMTRLGVLLRAQGAVLRARAG